MDSERFIIGFLAGILTTLVSGISLALYFGSKEEVLNPPISEDLDDEDDSPMVDCPHCGLPSEAALVFVVDDEELVSSYVMIYCLGDHQPIPVTTEWFEQYVNGQ